MSMNIERPKALIIALHDIWNTGSLDKVPNVYSPACIVHWPQSWGSKSRGHIQIKAVITHTRTVFPDWHEEILDLVVTPGESGDPVSFQRHPSAGIPRN